MAKPRITLPTPNTDAVNVRRSRWRFEAVPWTIRAGEVAQEPDCFACGGTPASDANGFGRCESCGTLMICPDPPPGELYRITLIACDSNGIPLPHGERRPVQIDWGERVEADGRPAKVFRVVDKQDDLYVEKVSRAGETIIDRRERLSQHVGHGSARRSSRPVRTPRRWVPLRFAHPA